MGDKPVLLAPMEDVTDPSFRLICKDYGADMMYTEFISSDGLIRDGEKSVRKLTILDVERPVGIQIYGNQIEPMVEAAIIAQVIMLAASAVLFRIICFDDTPFKVRPEQPLNVRDANPFGAFIELRHFISVTLILLFVIIAATSFGQYALEQSFNYAIKDIFHLSSAYNGIFKAIIALTSLALNSTLCIWMLKKTDINVSILPIVLSGLIPLGLLLGMDTVVPFAAMDILFFIFNAIRLPLLQNLCVANSTPETRNNIIGFYQSMTSFGAIFGAFLAGVLYPSGPKKPFVMAFVVFALGTVVTVLYVVRYKMGKKRALR